MAKDGIRLLAGAIKDLPKTTCLVLESEDDSVLDKYPEFNGRVSVKVFGELKGQSLLSWASGFVSSVSGKTIDKDAVFLLSELKGNLPIDLAGELEKLIAFVGERKSIKASDVEELVGRSVEASAFDIGWQIGRRDAASALRLVSDLMRSGKRPHEIVGVISWHLNRLLKALELRGNGRCDNDITAELGIRWKDTDAFFGQMKAFDINGVRSKIKALLAADLDIKRSRYDQGLVLEFAVIRLCLT
jgi:DNA polymerase-3 subunit delta